MALAYSLKKRSQPSPIYNHRRLRELPIPRTGRIFIHERNNALEAIFQDNTQNQDESASENVEENIVQHLPIDLQQAEDPDCKPVTEPVTIRRISHLGYEDFNNSLDNLPSNLLNNIEDQNEQIIASSSQINVGTMSPRMSPSIPSVAPPVPGKIH